MANNNYKPSSVKVINPYTFVPITPQKVNHKKRSELPNAKDYYQNQAELHTGVLHCTLQVVTPLAIPDIEKEMKDKEGHKSYPFYQDRGKYTVPGSSLRGVIRSAYETVTDSCFATVKNDTALSLRAEVNNPYQPGILIQENGELHLYKAKRYMLPVEGYKDLKDLDKKELNPLPLTTGKNKMRAIKSDGKNLVTGDKVRFAVSDKTHKHKGRKIWEGIVSEIHPCGEKDTINAGILFLGEPIFNKHGESVFVKTKPVRDKGGREFSSQSLEIAFKKVKETLKTYRDDAINKNLQINGSIKSHKGYQGFESLNPEDGIPLWYWYDENNNTISFSYAAIGRTMYEKTLNGLLGELNRCTDRNHLCEACLLFGMVGGSGKEEKGMGSRIRVTDAQVIGTPSVQKDVTLKELGMPRYSYLPFYATYTGEKNPNKKFPESYDDQGATIAGRKYYWNNEKANIDKFIYSVKNKEKDKTKRNATIDLMEPGAVFKFDVYYDGIKDEQLQKLLWVLTIGQNKLTDQLGENENLLCHKLGRGKPLGLGSVKIIVDTKEEREINLEGDGYHVNCVEQSAIEIKRLEGVSADAVRKVASMQPFTKENSEISIEYPNIVNQDKTEIPPFVQQKDNRLARHQWYSKNRNDRNEGQVLPQIMDENQALYQYYFVDNKPGGNGKKGR